jgi:argininosuccinate lyase
MSDEADADLTLLATDLADVLVRAGMPFRRAHEVVGEVVRYCLEHDKRLQDLTDTELKRFSKDFPKGTTAKLSVHHSVYGKMTAGGTSPKNVAAQAAQLKAQTSLIRKYLSHL